jgi:hypothetical protein
VRIASIAKINVERQTRIDRECLHKLLRQLQVKISQTAIGEIGIEDQKGTTAEVHCHFRQGFIHGDNRMPVASNAFGNADRLKKCLAKTDTHIFYGVVGVDVKVAFGPYSEVKEAVAGQMIQHVVEETNAGIDFRLAFAINGNFNRDRSFVCASFQLCAAHYVNSLLTQKEAVCEKLGQSRFHNAFRRLFNRILNAHLLKNVLVRV